MIQISLDPSGLHHALSDLGAHMDRFVVEGFQVTLESIAARAKQTTTFTDRTGLLRQSIQSDGVEGSFFGDGLIGTLGFGATAGEAAARRGRKLRRGRGFKYGLAQEFGSSNGVREKRFMRDAIAAEGPELLEDAVARAFRQAGFEVNG